jgi:hypothetical protein
MARIPRNGWTVIRSQDGREYGPIDLDTLQAWATDGRLEPDDRVQDRNREERPASEWEVLKMEWLVRRPDKETYGPTTAGAIRAMLAEGELALDSPIRNVRTGETGILGRHPLFHPAGALRADEVSLPVGPHDIDPDIRPAAQRMETQEQENPESQWDLSNFKRPAQDASLHDGEVARGYVPEVQTSDLGGDLPLAERKELEKRIQNLETRMAEWKQFARQYFLVGDREHHEPSQVELDELSRQLLAATEKVGELEQAMELLENQLQERIVENDRLIEERQATHRFYRLQLERLFEQIQSEQERSHRSLRNLAKSQRAHMHLLQRYKDLHQQFIDTQQELQQVRMKASSRD